MKVVVQGVREAFCLHRRRREYLVALAFEELVEELEKLKIETLKKGNQPVHTRYGSKASKWSRCVGARSRNFASRITGRNIWSTGRAANRIWIRIGAIGETPL